VEMTEKERERNKIRSEGVREGGRETVERG
jgi:hypothetical protein